MSNPLHAAYYADQASQHSVEITEHVPVARDTRRVRFHCPELARRILPGQFVMVRLAGFDDPLIGRPLALYNTVLDEANEPQAVDVVYLVKGKLTSRLAQFVPGQTLDVWGPLGNGFEPQNLDHLIMVAGGIGQTPFLALADEYQGNRTYGDPIRAGGRAERITLCYGARSGDLFAGLEDFQRAGVELRLATDDGSCGHHGLVTDLLEPLLAEQPGSHVVCCGPEPMMQAVARMTNRLGVSCQVSLETPMACGIGICFTCVAKVRDADGDWDYKRTCVDGPVFDATRIVWDA